MPMQIQSTMQAVPLSSKSPVRFAGLMDEPPDYELGTRLRPPRIPQSKPPSRAKKTMATIAFILASLGIGVGGGVVATEYMRVQPLQTQINELQAQQTEVDGLKIKLDTQTKQYDALNTNYQGALADIAEIDEKLKNLQTVNKSLASERDAVKSEAEAQRQLVTRLEEEKKALQEQVAALTAERNKLTEEKTALEKQVTELTEKLKKAEEDIKALKAAPTVATTTTPAQ